MSGRSTNRSYRDRAYAGRPNRGGLGCHHGVYPWGDIVTAAGELVRASAYENADLFWGLKGSGGNFGIVTALEFALYPLDTVYGGGIYYPVERSQEVLSLYADWVSELPDEMTTAISFLRE